MQSARHDTYDDAYDDTYDDAYDDTYDDAYDCLDNSSSNCLDNFEELSSFYFIYLFILSIYLCLPP